MERREKSREKREKSGEKKKSREKREKSGEKTRGRGYWGVSPDFCGDALSLKCSMY